jgi:hypothetical protein
VRSAAKKIAGTVDVADAGSTVTVLDGTTKIGTATVSSTGAWSTAVTLANSGANVITATDTNANGTGTSNSVTYTLQAAATSLTVNVANSNLSVTGGGGKVGLGVSVTAPAGATSTTVTIGGLPRYDVITDNLDTITFKGRSVTLTEAEVNSGLTLTSNYTGSGHPVATLTITAHDSVGGARVASAAKTITVTDPPPSASTGADGAAYSTLESLLGSHPIADSASPGIGAGDDKFALTSSQLAALSAFLPGDENASAYLATGAAYSEGQHLLGLNVAAYASPKAGSVLHG